MAGESFDDARWGGFGEFGAEAGAEREGADDHSFALENLGEFFEGAAGLLLGGSGGFAEGLRDFGEGFFFKEMENEDATVAFGEFVEGFVEVGEGVLPSGARNGFFASRFFGRGLPFAAVGIVRSASLWWIRKEWFDEAKGRGPAIF